MPRIVVAVVGLLLVAGVGSIAMQSAVSAGADQRTIVNETFTPAPAGGFASLAESDRDDVTYDRERQITVYSSSDEQLVPGQDYAWNRTNGSVETLSGGALDGASSANITYSFSRPTDSQQALAAMLAQFPTIAGLAAPFLGFMLFIRLLR